MKSLGKPEKTSKKQVIKDEKGRFVKGVSGNPEGRPPQSLNFSTKWFAFMERIAKENGVEPSELDHKMMTVAFKQMQEGKFPYWKDVNDRLYGQAKQTTEVENPTQNLAIEKLADSLRKLSEK
jgi:hypothetical protein